MSNNHGNTPAAWTSVFVAMIGFLVGSVGLMLDPINLPVFYVGLGLAVGSFFLFLVMAKMGLHEEKH
ncbi:HGxxPAAW family protein [Nocardioides sp. CPCC 205120]|uniref:HGxxPAAW family protein n=1 Tax=Nocardioides sp. CPCC 205120 TaxID=3406462 RepID=UPI003B50902A